MAFILASMLACPSQGLGYLLASRSRLYAYKLYRGCPITDKLILKPASGYIGPTNVPSDDRHRTP